MERDVRQIPFDQAKYWFLKKHYARRLPSCSFCFGLYVDGDLIGVVSYGVPASSSLIRGLCGEKYAKHVLELNRLIIEEGSQKNSASFLVSRSLKMLPKPSIVVSYADTSQGHVGYVYQACNFLYTGLSAKRTDWKIKGMEHLHGVTVADMSRGKENRAEYMREKFGDAFYLEERPRKHRYVYFVGCDDDIKKSLRYEIKNYPKGETMRYDSGEMMTKQMILF